MVLQVRILTMITSPHRRSALNSSRAVSLCRILAMRSRWAIIDLMDDIRQHLKPGVKVKVTQQIVARDHTWQSEVIGTIVALGQAKTGSWYAHSKDQRLWLDRMTLKKDNGETTMLNLDQYSRIDLL